jgi:tRNA pseudouridine55 synthase
MSGARPGQGAVSGVLLLDKPSGITSHAAVQKVRCLLEAAKAGHTGTLDPMATGLLPVCLGEATKFSHLLLDAGKVYRATIRLGVTTTTGDSEGEVTDRRPVEAGREQIEAVLKRFVGDTLQVPPMYSAIKHGGQPLYKLARAGREVPRAPRKITIDSLVLTEQNGDDIEVRIACSKGTYIRVLAEDIGRELGCGGSLAALRRESVGAFALDPGAVTLDRLTQWTAAERLKVLLPVDALVAALPRLDLDAAEYRRFCQGQAVQRRSGTFPGVMARIYGPGEEFLGVAELAEPGRITPKRLTARG